MVTKQSLLLEVDLETGQVVSSVEQLDGSFKDLDKSVEKTSDGVSAMTGHLDKMTGGAISAFKGIGGGIKSAITGMKSFKVALASTGIGLLIIAIGSLVSYFTKTQRGAEFLEKATASLSAVMAVITDRVSAFGETLFNAFQNPMQSIKDFGTSIKTYVVDAFTKVFDGIGLLGDAIMKLFDGDFSGAAETAKAGFVAIADGATDLIPATAIIKAVVPVLVNDLVPAMTKAASAASNLAQRSIDLRKAQRDLKVEMAESRAQFKEYNAIAEDTTRGTEERLAAAQKAIDLEKNLMSERQRLAQEELDIFTERMALSENTEEDYERLAELEAGLIQIREEAAERLTTVTNKRNIIQQQALKEEEDRYARMTELEDAMSTDKEREMAALVKEYEDKFALAEEFGYGEQELMIMQKEAIAAIEKKYSDAEQALRDKEDKDKADKADKEFARQQALRDQKFEMAQGAVGAIMALNNAFSKSEGKDAKKAFQRNKQLQIAQALINTAQGVTAQLAVPQDALTGANFVKAGIVAATGIAQVASISKTRFQADGGGDGGGGGIRMPEAPGNVAPQANAPSSVDFGFLGAGDNGQTFQAYVVAEQMTTSQQASQQIQDQAALVG